jgi:hypothetical protein
MKFGYCWALRPPDMALIKLDGSLQFIMKDSTRCNNLSNFIIPYLYEAQRVSGDTPPIIRSLNLHWQPLVFHTWKVVYTCSWWTLSGTIKFIIPYLYEDQHVSDTPPIIRSLKLHWQPLGFHTWKVVCTCSWWTLSGTVCLMMGGMSPETCWASYKYGIIKSDTLLHLVGSFFMNYTMMHRPTNVKFITVFTTARHGILSLSHEQAESSPQPAILLNFHFNIITPSISSHPKLSLRWNFKTNSVGLCGYHLSNLQVLSISNFLILTSLWHLIKSSQREKLSTATVFPYRNTLTPSTTRGDPYLLL